MKKPNTLNIGFDFDLPDLSIDLSKLSMDAVNDRIEEEKPRKTKPKPKTKQDQLELF